MIDNTPTVFVIDDDPAARGSLGFLLRCEGYEVCTHASLGAMLDSGGNSPNACLLLDLRMPEMDGMEALRRLRRSGCEWPVILVTGDIAAPEVASARRRGVFAVLEKPFSDDDLLTTVSRALAATAAPPARAAGAAPD